MIEKILAGPLSPPSQKKSTEKILGYFNIKSNYVICPEDSSKGKPNKDPMDLLKEKLNDNKTIFYVGDMLSDLQFSVESGVEYIHYSGGIDGPLNEHILNKFYKINNLMEIKLIIEKF